MDQVPQERHGSDLFLLIRGASAWIKYPKKDNPHVELSSKGP